MKKRITSILLALVLCLSLLPTGVLADAPTDYPFVPSIGTVTGCIVDGYAYDSDWNGTPDATVPLYTVTVPYGTQELTLTFSEKRIAYGYDSAGTYLNSCAAYEDNGRIGEMTATVRLVNDKFADFIRVQTPYDESWSSTTLYAVKFEYTRDTVLQKAAWDLTWDKLTNESADAVTYAPTLRHECTVEEKTVTIAWSCNDVSGAFSISEWGAYIDRPAAVDAPCVLTATLSYDDETFVKRFPLTVKAEGINADKVSVVSFKTLMDTIAASYTSTTDAWTVLDMAGYGKNAKGDDYGWSSDAAQAIAKATLDETNDLPGDLTSFDVNNAYAIYTMPYVLLAYDAEEVDDSNYDCTRNAMKTAMVGYLNSLDNNYAGVDEVAPALAALAPYYGRGDAELDTAVRAGISWLASQQNSDGTYSYWGTSNANTTALAVVSLAALGIDAHRDSRFIKDGHSAVEGLLSFALADNSGFGYKGNVTKNDLATEQGFRALVSYARFAEAKGQPYNIYLQAVVGKDAPADPQITATVKAQPVTPTDQSISVSVRISGDTGVWLSKNLSVKAGASVYDVLSAVLSENGYTWEGTSSYISYITSPTGKKLGEFSTGPNSGWLYKVNGVLPSDPIGEYQLNNNASVVFYYTNDWTLDPDAGAYMEKPVKKPEKQGTSLTPEVTAKNGVAAATVDRGEIADAISAAMSDGAKEIVIAPVVKGSAGKVSVELPKTAVNDIVESSDAALNIQTDVGSIDIPSDTLSEILKAAGSTDIAMSVEKVNPTAVKDSLPAGAKLENAVAVEFSISSGDKTIASFGGKALKVSVPVDAKKFADGKTCTAFVVSADGKAETTTAKIVSGEAVVEMRHFSTVVITDQVAAAAFSDVAADTYYYDAVLWAAGNGVTAGTDDTHFSPNRPCTRAQVATFLWRAAGCPKAEGKTPFTDVAADTYYSDAVTWAYEQGITGGTSATTFSPNTAVTRAQVVTFLYRYEKPAAGTAVNPFADVQKNAYYYDAVQWAYANGITDGTDGTHFSPNTVCTRGQIVTFLYRDFDSELSESSGVEMRLAEAAAYVLKTTPAPRFGSVGGEWAVLGLARSGSAVPESYYADYYTALEKTVSEAKGVLSTRKYTEYSRVIVALAAIGKDARDVAGYDLTMPLGDYDNTIRQGTGGSVWALIALDSRNYPMPICPDAATSATRQMYIDRLLATQNTDGGWGIGAESASDIDMTAMALQALAKYQEQKAAADATERALAFLGGKQDENGGYASSESTAQVIVALCSLGIDLGDIRFIKNGHTLLDDLESYRVSGGGYRHTRDGEVNQMASEQALYALAAVQRAQTGMPGLYRMEQ